MNIISRIENFAGNNQDEFLAFSFAYAGEFLVKSAEKEIFRPNKISSVQYNVLCTLAVQSPRPAGDISKFILGSAPNFSSVLNRMEKEGLIKREISTIDRREIFVFVTPKGKKLFLKIRKEFQKFFTKKFEKIPQEEKENMKKIILTFSEYL